MTPEQSPICLTLGESLDMAAAGPLLTGIIEARGQSLTLDASATRRVGGQCLQVLLAARETWAADGISLQIIDPSPEFRDGVALLGCPDLAPDLAPDSASVQD